MPRPEDCAMLSAYFDGLEEVRREVEAKWGAGRVELLAGDELRAKWRRQRALWADAYRAAWEAPVLTRDLLADVEARTAAMRRGFAALDAAASEAGHRPVAPWVWEVVLKDGTTAALVQTNAEASKVIAEGRYLAVYTLAEIGAVLAVLPEALRLAKQVFPGSKFQAPATVDRLHAGPWNPDGDEIPFGREPAEEPAPEEELPW